MPVTLPAHAAAVLPFMRARRVLPPLALVVGSCVPDLGYVFPGRSPTSHTLLGLLTFCLPVGICAFFWAHALALPVIAQAATSWLGINWRALLTPETRELRRPAEWLGVSLALLLGAATHLLWDGFTHRYMWPASELYGDIRVPFLGRQMPVTRLLQHASTLVGSVLVFLWLRRAHPAPSAQLGPPAHRLWLTAATALCAVFALSLTLARGTLLPGLEAMLWSIFWPTLTGALVGLTLACLAVRAGWKRA